MSFVHQTYREWAGIHEDCDSGKSVETVLREDEGSVLDMLNHGLSKHGVLRDIVASFVVTSVEADQIRQCVEYLIGENGIEWVWKSRDIVKDIMEFHGFIRQNGVVK